MRVAKIAIRCSFSRSVTQFFSNFQETFIVVSGCFEIFQTVMHVAKIAICFSFSPYVTQFFSNFQFTFMEFYGCLEMFQTVMRVAKIADRIVFEVAHFTTTANTHNCELKVGDSFLQNKLHTICVNIKPGVTDTVISLNGLTHPFK